MFVKWGSLRNSLKHVCLYIFGQDIFWEIKWLCYQLISDLRRKIVSNNWTFITCHQCSTSVLNGYKTNVFKAAKIKVKPTAGVPIYIFSNVTFIHFLIYRYCLITFTLTHVFQCCSPLYTYNYVIIKIIKTF